MTHRPSDPSPIPADRLIVDPARATIGRDVEIVVADGRVAEVRPSAGGRTAGVTDWVLPALADAHDHGRGLPTLAYGAADQALELWIPALSLQPRIDPGLLATLAFAKLARSGVGAVVHCHNPQDPGRAVDEAVAVARAARAVGIRLAYVVPMADQNPLGYGPDAAILAHVEGPAREQVAAIRRRPAPVPGDQIELVDRIAEAVGGDGVTVQYGPVGPQWASDVLLAAVAEASAQTGRRVHMHLFETALQREWADARYPAGLLDHLDRIGLLSPRLTVAHGVWLGDDELGLLAVRGVIVSVNTSSNLRLRSGTAPVERMRRAGTAFAFGMDGMSLDDDEDALRELRLTHLLHAGTGLDEGLTPSEALHRATAVGHAVVDGSTEHGVVGPGAPADLVVVDGEALAGDVADGACDEIALIVARASARHVRRVLVAGRVIVDDGRAVGVDEAAVADEVASICRASAAEIAEALPTVRAHQDGLAAFYRSGGHVRPLLDEAGLPA